MKSSELRQNIMAISVKKYDWSYDEFHDIMEDWGFGRSLRALSDSDLIKLRNELLGIQDYKGFKKFDKQGMYMWHQACIAWPENTMNRLQHYWVKHFYKSHWEILTSKERRQTINMLKGYNDK